MFTTNPQLIAVAATLAMFVPAAGAQAAPTQAQHQARHFQTAGQARHLTNHDTRRSTAKYLRDTRNWA